MQAFLGVLLAAVLAAPTLRGDEKSKAKLDGYWVGTLKAGPVDLPLIARFTRGEVDYVYHRARNSENFAQRLNCRACDRFRRLLGGHGAVDLVQNLQPARMLAVRRDQTAVEHAVLDQQHHEHECCRQQFHSPEGASQPLQHARQSTAGMEPDEFLSATRSYFRFPSFPACPRESPKA